MLLDDHTSNVYLKMTFGQQNTEKEAHEQLSYAYEHGINIIDTAEAVSFRMTLCSLPNPILHLTVYL